jgi:hypothetical protein
MANMQISVGFRRETGVYAVSVFAGSQIFLYKFLDEIQ